MSTSTIRYETPEHVLCDATTPGAIPFIAGGLQDDGTYLYKLDLDQHTPEQDAAGLLAYLRKRLPLFDRLRVRRTKRSGYHIPFRYHRALVTGKLYDPRNGQHAGELLDARIELDHYDASDIPTLTALEFSQLQAAIHGLAAVPVEGRTSTIVDTSTPRKDRIAEGEQLIAGWGSIRDWHTRLDALCDARPMLAKRRAELRTLPDRSVAYSRFVQSLMLHAIPLGTTTESRCAMVAAMAIGSGANGKEQDKDYRIERDTAALIAKIIHGDAMEPRADGTIPHWITPTWVNGQQLPKVEPVVAPEPVKRPDHATVRRDLRIATLRRKLSAIEPDEWGRRHFLIERISSAPRRTAQADLKWLRDHGEIVTGQIGGNGTPYAVLTSQFGGAKPCKKPDTATLPAAENWGASAEPLHSVPMPKAATQDVQCIKVERTPKSSAPTAQPAGGAGGAPARAPAGAQVLGAPLPAAAPIVESGGASYDPALVKRAKRRPKQPSKFRAAAAKRRRQARLATMSVAELKERRWRLARRAERAANTAQAEIFDDLLAEMTYELARKAPEYDPDAYVWRNKDLQQRLQRPPSGQLPLVDVPDTDPARVATGIVGRLKAVTPPSTA